MFLRKAAKKFEKKVIRKIVGRKNNMANDDQILRKLSKQIEEIKKEKKKISEINSEQINKIRNLEKMLEDNIEEQKRKEIQRKIEKEEEEKKEQLKKIEEINKREEKILKCKEFLSNELSSCVYDSINKFNMDVDKRIDSLENEDLKEILDQYKLKLTILFNKLFAIEKIFSKINNKFIELLNENANLKELCQMNFLVIGTSGVGKSTLINELFGEQIAKEGTGQRCTTTRKRYESKKYPFISFTDSMGTELGDGHNLKDVEKDTLDEINNKLNSNNPNEHIHGIIYCTTSNRFFEDELRLIQKIRAKYDGKKLPIVIAYTRASDDKEADSIKIAINNFLNKYNEKISNEIFDIEFIKIMAREKEYAINGQTIFVPCYGLSNLISTCYKKGEKVYKIAIKNSLIQIAKKSLNEYVNNIFNKIYNYLNFLFYLQKKFEPNFTDYISFCFEKITDIYNQKGINVSELDKLDNYLENIESKNIEDISEQKICMFCNKKPINPYCCDFCGTLTCENCYLKKFQKEDKVACLNCNKSNFSIFLQDNIIDENFDNKIKNEKILENNLNIQSKKEIEKYSKDFKTEMLKVETKKFGEFTQNISIGIYYQILDKYRENALSRGINIGEVMKSKEELKEEITNIINKELKESAEEKFLTKNTSILYQDIILTFKTEMIKNR